MKKIFLCIFIIFCSICTVHAEKWPDFSYKNIGLKDKITYDIETNTWSKTTGRNNTNYFVKVKGFGEYYDYLDSEENFVFSTNCEYEFIYNNSLIGYSNRDMRFYEILYDNKSIGKRALTKEEVEQLLPDYRILSLSEFSPKTNSLKIKKHNGANKIMLYNDTNYHFDNYTFTSGNTPFEQYSLRGFLTVHKPGMIEFSQLGENNKIWYVLLIR